MVKRPSQQSCSHVGTEPPLPGYHQYFWGLKHLAQHGGGIFHPPPTYCSIVRHSTTDPQRSTVRDDDDDGGDDDDDDDDEIRYDVYCILLRSLAIHWALS